MQRSPAKEMSEEFYEKPVCICKMLNAKKSVLSHTRVKTVEG
jgi:hypothetical protein